MLQPDAKNRAPTAQTGKEASEADAGDAGWLSRAQNAYTASTSYLDANYRKSWDDGLRAFNNQHPGDSKYNNAAYEKRSRIYRPRIRTIIRKNEAAAAAAFFSNMDVVSIHADDPTDKRKAAGADVIKQLLQYRLTKTIPWYQTLIGALQDAQVTGVACAHLRWDYEEEPLEQAAAEQEPNSLAQVTESESEFPVQTQLPHGAMMVDAAGMLHDQLTEVNVRANVTPDTKILKDEPAIELIPAENLRIDAGASWIDPVNSSPFLIHLMPMYVLDVKARIEKGEWREVSEGELSSAVESKSDSTRAARQKDRDDQYSMDGKSVDDYEVVWVQRHIHRRDGQDWEFYTLSDVSLLSTPRPLKEVVLHGKRPYVMGVCVLETHKIYPSSIPTLGRGLADETNEIANQRIDNIKFVLNKKWFVKRGKDADVPGLVRNVPGGVVMLDDPQNDVKEVNWADVTASAFQEAQGIGQEMDELLGNFNPAQLMMNGGANNPARNMAMLGQTQAIQTEYLLRTFVETFVQPCLRQLVLLEQEYETDGTVLALAGKKAEAFQKLGADQVTDDMIRQELLLTVNVGMGATDPMAKLNKFLTAMSSYTNMIKSVPAGVDMREVGKEIFGHLGYADGSRFFNSDDPQVMQMQQQLQQAQQMIQQLNMKLQDKQTVHQVKLAATKMVNEARTQDTVIKETNKRDIAEMKETNANRRALATHWRALHERAHESTLNLSTGAKAP